MNTIMPPLKFVFESTRRIRVSNTEAPTDSYVDVHPDPENRALLDVHDRTVVSIADSGCLEISFGWSDPAQPDSLIEFCDAQGIPLMTIPIRTLLTDISIGPESVYFVHRLKVMVPPSADPTPD